MATRKADDQGGEGQIIQNEPECQQKPDERQATEHVPESTEQLRPKSRSWTERYVQPVKYKRFTAKDQTGREQIMFQISLPNSETKPPEEVVQIFRDHKRSPEGYSTGLHFENDKVQGKVWKIPDTPRGREVADSLDQELDKLAKRLEGASTDISST